MKLNLFPRFHLVLACGLFISCQNVQRNYEGLDNSSHEVLSKMKHFRQLDNYLEKNRNERHADVKDRSFKIFKNIHSDEDLSNLGYKNSAGSNKIRQMKILRKVDFYIPRFVNENKNEYFAPKTNLEFEMGGKEYKNVKTFKNFSKNLPGSRIRRELPEMMIGYTGRAETKERISSADKFLKLNEKERERLLEKVFNEINRKLNRFEYCDNCTDDNGTIKVKPQLLILNSKSKPKREGNSETKPFISKAVENSYDGKTNAAKPSGYFNDATKTLISSDLQTNLGINSIGKQTGRNNVDTDQFTTNSKNFSKREDTQAQADGIHPTTVMSETSDPKPSTKQPMDVRRVQENKSEINNKDETISDQTSNPSEKSVKIRNKNGQPQVYHILKNPLEKKFSQNTGSSDSSKMSEKTSKNYDEDDELLEYIKNNVKNCLREMRKGTKEEKETPETKERNHIDETVSDTQENHPKETSPDLTKQLSLLDKLNSLNPNSPGFQLLWNILQSNTSKPNIQLEENEKPNAKNVSPHTSPLMAEENDVTEVSSEENGNDSYDMITQADLKSLNDLARTYTKSNIGTTRFDQLWETDLIEELFLK